MDIRAILLTGGVAEAGPTLVDSPQAERFSGEALALLPVLGRPPLLRLIDHLKKSGIDSISVLHAGDSLPGGSLPEDARQANLRYRMVATDQIWRAAEEEFENLVQDGAELVLIARVGAYAEIDIDSMIQFHLDQRNHTTQVSAADGLLDYFLLSGSRRNDAAFLLRHKLQAMRVQTLGYRSLGYVNRLQTPADLRMLAWDGLMQKNSVCPIGNEVRPGIWIAANARVDRSVRLVAPCYIGASCKIRAGALITRGTSIEHHSVVDCGTVVEASTLLPLSYVGAGLDLMHSVVGWNRIASVKHRAEVAIDDSTLVSMLPATSMLRTVRHAANLIAFVPRQIVRSLMGSSRARETQLDSKCPPDGGFDAAAVSRPVAQEQQALSSRVVAGMREYGNQ